MKAISTKRAAGLLLASALVCSLCTVPAFAAIEKDGTSEVVVTKADPGQISVTIPQQIPLAAGEDGSFMAPTAQSSKLVNNSAFAVHVAKVTATPIVADTLVAKGASLTATDGAYKMWLTVKAGNDSALDLSTASDGSSIDSTQEWTMEAGTGELPLAFAGAMTADASGVKGVHALDIVWTVAV